MSPRQVEQQLVTNLLGPMNVTRAVLPVMRRQRSGHVIPISSGAGLMAFEYSSVYAASKSGLEGWMGRCAKKSRHSASRPRSSTRGSSGRVGQSGVVDMARAVDRRLRRAQRSATEWWAGPGWSPGRRSRQARSGPLHDRRRRTAATTLRRRCRCVGFAERKIAELQAQIESHRALSESLTSWTIPHDTEDHT